MLALRGSGALTVQGCRGSGPNLCNRDLADQAAAVVGTNSGNTLAPCRRPPYPESDKQALAAGGLAFFPLRERAVHASAPDGWKAETVERYIRCYADENETMSYIVKSGATYRRRVDPISVTQGLHGIQKAKSPTF
jgi:hypothetical protein